MLFDKNQNHNGSKQIPLQYETVNPNPKLKTHKQSTHITLVYIYIHTWPHTHKNSNTQTHSQTTINTHTQHNRGRSQEEKSGREKLGGTDYSVLQFENLKKKNCNDLFERERNWVRGSTNLSNISHLAFADKNSYPAFAEITK